MKVTIIAEKSYLTLVGEKNNQKNSTFSAIFNVIKKKMQIKIMYQMDSIMNKEFDHIMY